VTNQEQMSHEAIAAKLSRVLREQIPASFVARTEEVCGKPFAELTRQDLSHLSMLTQLDSIEAENDQAQIEGELKRPNDDADCCLVCWHPHAHVFGLCDSCLAVALDSVRTAVRYAVASASPAHRLRRTPAHGDGPSSARSAA
jgi:hypothetical protein